MAMIDKNGYWGYSISLDDNLFAIDDINSTFIVTMNGVKYSCIAKEIGSESNEPFMGLENPLFMIKFSYSLADGYDSSRGYTIMEVSQGTDTPSVATFRIEKVIKATTSTKVNRKYIPDPESLQLLISVNGTDFNNEGTYTTNLTDDLTLIPNEDYVIEINDNKFRCTVKQDGENISINNQDTIEEDDWGFNCGNSEDIFGIKILKVPDSVIGHPENVNISLYKVVKGLSKSLPSDMFVKENIYTKGEILITTMEAGNQE